MTSDGSPFKAVVAQEQLSEDLQLEGRLRQRSHQLVVRKPKASQNWQHDSFKNSAPDCLVQCPNSRILAYPLTANHYNRLPLEVFCVTLDGHTPTKNLNFCQWFLIFLKGSSNDYQSGVRRYDKKAWSLEMSVAIGELQGCTGSNRGPN